MIEKKNLVNAITRIDAYKDICIKNKSGFYNTKPIGGPPQPDYVNCVIELETEMEPKRMLGEFKKIELELGRRPCVRWGPRIIDIDILLYGNRIINDHNIKIPHERMHERTFVLEPLCEISPDFEHPVLRKTICELLKELRVSENINH
ncbi:MAG: 2-amino-4-hydroxy-6- hydroxymethyldihydropteridine [Candidatus Scalindua rubra]|uniref:2-amino-4-hydroxy-6-hydroxymethyldihydropteridine pyrophosphokinase n=1 Tax=Candidatus Scalindua rubra TaxID=1872076 RepID=A0A1E3X8P8_9BACT|nr:MAG: 2-amino-4-hydroxy-6- hydroxymethyldihydropteridine [Candidatus Scalindua rubra]